MTFLHFDTLKVESDAHRLDARHFRSLRTVILVAAFFVLFFLGPGFSRAQVQTTARVTGYVEHQFSASRVNERWTQLDYDRFRVDLGARAGRSTRASVAVIYQIYRGDTNIGFGDILPANLSGSLDSLSFEIEDRQYVNHAYITLRQGGIELTVGKQYLAWGAGWVFNPTELFRPKNALEPAYDREGIGALSARIPFGTLSDVQLVYVPDGGFDSSGKLIRVRSHMAGFDISALAATLDEPGPAAAFFSTEDQTRRRATLGGDITGEVLGLGTWIEGTWNDLSGDQWVELTAGGNYTLDGGTFILLEGHYNERGKTDSPYPIGQWLGRIYGSQRTLGRTTLFGAISRPVKDLWTIGVSAIANTGDGSVVLIPSVAYAFAENVDLLFNGFVYIGPEGSEYGMDRTGAFVRGRVYF